MIKSASCNFRLLNQASRVLLTLRNSQFNVSFAKHSDMRNQEQVTLKEYLRNKISATGPISVAEFMKTALTNTHSVSVTTRAIFFT